MAEHAVGRRDMAAHDLLVILDPAVVTGKDEIVRLSSRRRFMPSERIRIAGCGNGIIRMLFSVLGLSITFS